MTIEAMQLELKDIESQRDKLIKRAYELRQKIVEAYGADLDMPDQPGFGQK